MSGAPVPVPLSCAGNFQETWEELGRLARGGTPVHLSGLDRLAPAEAGQVLAFFLHDPAVCAPIEPFATLLAAMLGRQQTGLWELFGGPQEAFLETLPRDQPDCMVCASFPVCQGYGAWAGSCATWRALVTGLAAAARELGRLNRSSRRSPHVHS